MIRIPLVTALAVLLHVVLGWEWTLLAGIAAGLWIGPLGWLVGAAAVGLDWLVLVFYNFYVNSRAVGLMTETLGHILGNMPSSAIVALTLLIGVLIGGIGGASGTQLRRLIRGTHQPVPQP